MMNNDKNINRKNMIFNISVENYKNLKIRSVKDEISITQLFNDIIKKALEKNNNKK